MYTVCKIKNLTGSVETLRGHEFQIDEVYTISDSLRVSWATSDEVISGIFNGDFEVHDESEAITGISDQLDWLKNYMPHVIEIEKQPPFAAKTMLDGSKLFKRLHGVSQALSSGSNDVIFTVPYNHVKMIGARIVNAEAGDTCDFLVLDSVNGDYTGTPNAVLNQYGYNVCIAKDNHMETCKYDADLYLGMQVKFVYNSVSAKTCGFNFDISEVVPVT